jgi:predicted nucleic acid-binding protein
MDLLRYNINMTTIHLSALVSPDTAAFEILKAVRKYKTEIVISASSIQGKTQVKNTKQVTYASAWVH